MNLVIDVGNTSVKIGVFDIENLVFKEIVRTENLSSFIKKISNTYPLITHAIVSSVSNADQQAIRFLQDTFSTIILSHNLKMPFRNLYTTPKTLGVDRLALVAAAVFNFRNKNALIIDAGTCITYDFKNKKEEYYGGAISPGVQLRYKALHNYTSKLPLLEAQYPENHLGNSTNEAIHAGVVLGIIYEIDGVITEYCNTYPDLTVILTGGDAHFLSKRLKNSIFATSNFLLEGLNYILAFNNTQ